MVKGKHARQSSVELASALLSATSRIDAIKKNPRYKRIPTLKILETKGSITYYAGLKMFIDLERK